MIDWVVVLEWIAITANLVAVAINLVQLRNRWRVTDAAFDTARVALDILDLMEEAHDPGRDVHERLARALEATLVRPPDGDDRPNPAARRAAAMARAATVIDAIRRANLILTAKED